MGYDFVVVGVETPHRDGILSLIGTDFFKKIAHVSLIKCRVIKFGGLLPISQKVFDVIARAFLYSIPIGLLYYTKKENFFVFNLQANGLCCMFKFFGIG